MQRPSKMQSRMRKPSTAHTTHTTTTTAGRLAGLAGPGVESTMLVGDGVGDPE